MSLSRLFASNAAIASILLMSCRKRGRGLQTAGDRAEVDVLEVRLRLLESRRRLRVRECAHECVVRGQARGDHGQLRLERGNLALRDRLQPDATAHARD